jgi:hypothetical protein
MTFGGRDFSKRDYCTIYIYQFALNIMLKEYTKHNPYLTPLTGMYSIMKTTSLVSTYTTKNRITIKF